MKPTLIIGFLLTASAGVALAQPAGDAGPAGSPDDLAKAADATAAVADVSEGKPSSADIVPAQWWQRHRWQAD